MEAKRKRTPFFKLQGVQTLIASLLCILLGVEPAEAKKALEKARGHISQAIENHG